MHVTFYGAAREVTGSMHLVATENDRILLDFGMFQGRRREAFEKNRVIPFDPSLVTNVVLSHAHIDHSGRLPVLARSSFTGRVITTRVTMDACGYLLPDSAHIQESDALYLNYKTLKNALKNRGQGKGSGKKKSRKEREIAKLLKKNKNQLDDESIREWMERLNLKTVEPLYTREDADNALNMFDGYPFRVPVTVGKNMTCTLYEAGHILGSAIVILKVQENGREVKIGFTGDLGRFNKPIIKDPALDFAQEDRDLDLLILESTYGDRTHDPVGDLKPKLEEVLKETYERRGCLVIPSFAYGRTQELLYVIHEIYDAGGAVRVPVYVDSPLAINLTRVFGEHPESYDRETHKTFLERGKNPFFFEQVHFTETVEESMQLMRDETPHIVISASGMCEAGRILHHLRYKIHNPKNTIMIVGFMAKHTLGRRIQELGAAYEASGRSGEVPLVRFYNKEYPLKARVVKMDGFSAHADRGEMLRFLTESNLNVRRIALVHGEEEQSLAFKDFLGKRGFSVTVPRAGETVRV